MKFSILDNFNFFIAYLIFLSSFTYGKKIILFNKVNCNGNPENLVYTKCEIFKNDDYPHGAATIEFDLKKKLEKLYVHVDSFKLTNGEYKPFILKFDVEICSLMEKESKGNDIFSQIINKLSKKVESNAFHKCPFENNLYFRNIAMDISEFPIIEPFVQPGSFRLVTNYYLDKDKTNLLGTTDMYSQVKEK